MGKERLPCRRTQFLEIHSRCPPTSTTLFHRGCYGACFPELSLSHQEGTHLIKSEAQNKGQSRIICRGRAVTAICCAPPQPSANVFLPGVVGPGFSLEPGPGWQNPGWSCKAGSLITTTPLDYLKSRSGFLIGLGGRESQQLGRK